MLETLKMVRGNLSSLMCAYPDLYPRHAFQGTYDEVCRTIENVGTCAGQPTLFDELQGRGTMTDILTELRGVQRLQGDTFSSAEVLGMVGRAADEIDRLTNALLAIAYMDCFTRPGEQPAAELMRDLAQQALSLNSNRGDGK